MGNERALKAGSAKAKQIIQGHLKMIFQNALEGILAEAVRLRREQTRHNMTGNTVNSYAGGMFIDGSRVAISLGQPGKSPLRGKLREGERFKKGQTRWDGDIQQGTFMAKVDTDGRTEAAASIDFINSYKPQSKGLEIVVCDGAEYASYQENVYNIDVLTRSFANAPTILAKNLKPMPD